MWRRCSLAVTVEGAADVTTNWSRDLFDSCLLFALFVIKSNLNSAAVAICLSKDHLIYRYQQLPKAFLLTFLHSPGVHSRLHNSPRMVTEFKQISTLYSKPIMSSGNAMTCSTLETFNPLSVNLNSFSKTLKYVVSALLLS